MDLPNPRSKPSYTNTCRSAETALVARPSSIDGLAFALSIVESSQEAWSAGRSKGVRMEEQPHGVGLDEALEALRAELESARAKAAGHELQFPVTSVTVELKVGVTKSKGGKAGFHVPLIEAELGGSLGVDRQTLQTVTLVLGAPVGPDGGPVKVASAGDKLKG
jgi:hypothetical protein